jgi:GNAT superfamily N-acetyltransferase
VREVTTPSAPGRPDELTPADSRWLAWHEARSHGLAGREIRLLGDAVLLHDAADREPFWNRVAGIAWPASTGAFDRRLTEIVALFAGLDRIPHVWPMPGYDEPSDLVDRLLSHGFEDMGTGIVMLLDPVRRAALPPPSESGPAGSPRVEISHIERPADAKTAARDVSLVLIEAFDVDPDRRESIERETEILFGRPEVHVCLARIDSEPAAVVRRSTFAGASYLSSIGTRPAFRGIGLGRLVTDIAVGEALATGSRWTYLGVFTDNAVARQLYEGLGFVMVGGPAPDLLLRR